MYLSVLPRQVIGFDNASLLSCVILTELFFRRSKSLP
jgi:hypothetical protein